MLDFATAASQDTNQIFQSLETSAQGISQQIAAARLKIVGRNRLSQKRITPLQILGRQFKNAFLYLLVGASLISLFLGQTQQALTILAIIFLTALFGFFLEYRSQKAEEKLSLLLKKICWVKRGGEKEEVDEELLVPGDVVLLESGDIVPADCRLLSIENFQAEEAVLTGESTPIYKITDKIAKPDLINKAKNLVFAGTAVQSGSAEAVVFATGQATQIGKISQLVAQTNSKSSFDQAIKSVSGFILKLTVIALLLIFLANILIKGAGADITSLLLFTIALAVGIVPEALPVVALFTMSLGALALARKKVIVKRLTALEDLGNVQLLCVDKTGTLTENKLEVGELMTINKKDFWSFFMASVVPLLGKKGDLRSYLDKVVYDYALRLGITQGQYTLIADEPFRPDLRRDRIIIKKQDKTFLISKGAPETLLKLCSFEAGPNGSQKLRPDYWQQLLQKEGVKGRRVYGLAVKQIKQLRPVTKNYVEEFDQGEKQMIFVGFVSFSDPIKKTACEAIRQAEKLGVVVKILTGDSVQVAGWAAQAVGLIKNPNQVVSNEVLEKMKEGEFEKTVLTSNVFARVNPEQKYKIVQVLQKKYWVAFLGDGVNDAPALKLANVSLVVNKASEVAKAAADVILLQKDLKIILVGIAQGRRIFSNVLKYIQYTLASNFGNSYSLALISLLLPFLPMLPAQILLVNFLSDFPLISVATDTVDSLQTKQPVKFDLRQSGFLIIFLGLISMVFDFLFFAVFRHQPAHIIQTLWFVESVLSENIFILSIRSKLPFWRAVRPSAPLLGLLVITTIMAVLIPYSFLAKDFIFAQPTWGQIGLVFIIVCLYFVTTETVKIIYYKTFNSSASNGNS
jgi:Mg2+-importing ATPase